MTNADGTNFVHLLRWCWELGIDVELSHHTYAYPNEAARRDPVLTFRRGDRTSQLTGRDFDELYRVTAWSAKKIAVDLLVPDLKFNPGDGKSEGLGGGAT